MPELPEVETIKNELKPNLIGRKISDIIINRQQIINYPLKTFTNKIVENNIINITRRAKLLIFELDKLWMIAHLRMTGAFIFDDYYNKLSFNNKLNRLIIILDNSKYLIYQDQRALGKIYLFNTNQKNNYLNSYGIEPFDKTFTINFLTKLIQNRKSKIKQFLLDQKKIVGIGNIYASEILYLAKINPFRLTGSLSKKEVINLYNAIKEILSKAIKMQGTTFKDYRRTSGEKGKFQKSLCVYNKELISCKMCNGKIKRAKINARSTYYCTNCQI